MACRVTKGRVFSMHWVLLLLLMLMLFGESEQKLEGIGGEGQHQLGEFPINSLIKVDRGGVLLPEALKLESFIPRTQNGLLNEGKMISCSFYN